MVAKCFSFNHLTGFQACRHGSIYSVPHTETNDKRFHLMCMRFQAGSWTSTEPSAGRVMPFKFQSSDLQYLETGDVACLMVQPHFSLSSVSRTSHKILKDTSPSVIMATVSSMKSCLASLSLARAILRQYMYCSCRGNQTSSRDSLPGFFSNGICFMEVLLRPKTLMCTGGIMHPLRRPAYLQQLQRQQRPRQQQRQQIHHLHISYHADIPIASAEGWC